MRGPLNLWKHWGKDSFDVTEQQCDTLILYRHGCVGSNKEISQAMIPWLIWLDFTSLPSQRPY